jgi:hypothetical protein
VSKFGGGVGKPRTAAMSIDHNRPSRHSYGFWDGTSREDKVRWFLSKVRSPFSIPSTGHALSLSEADR